MTLAQKIEQILKDELKPENIKTIIDLAEFLKVRESQKKWAEINESEHEFITAEEKNARGIKIREPNHSLSKRSRVSTINSICEKGKHDEKWPNLCAVFEPPKGLRGLHRKAFTQTL